MPFAEDLDAFFDTAEFAESAQLDGLDVVGIFDEGLVEGAGDAAASTPIFTLPTASVPEQSTDLPFVRGAISYRVVGHQPDGTGLSVLVLAKT